MWSHWEEGYSQARSTAGLSALGLPAGGWILFLRSWLGRACVAFIVFGRDNGLLSVYRQLPKEV